MTITIELPPEVRSELRTHLAHLDAKGLRLLLAEVFAPAVEALLRQKSDQIKGYEYEATADRLAEEWATYVKSEVSVRQSLASMFAPAVEALLQPKSDHINAAEFEASVDKLADEWALHVKSGPPPLSDYAVSRAGIYENHP